MVQSEENYFFPEYIWMWMMTLEMTTTAVQSKMTTCEKKLESQIT